LCLELLENRLLLSGDPPSLPDLVRLHLEVTDTTGMPVAYVRQGETFLLRGYTEDLRDLPPESLGVFSAYLDVTFPAGLISYAGPIGYGPLYPYVHSGELLSGLIDEVGAISIYEPLGAGKFLLFEVEFQAVGNGVCTLAGDPADVQPAHEVTLFDPPTVVPPDQIDYEAATVYIVPANAFVVTNTNDSGPGSLRQAIEDANARPGADSIVFAIPPTDPNFRDVDSWLAEGDPEPDAFVITPLAALPALTEGATSLDGATQVQYTGDTNAFGPEIVLDGQQAGDADGLVLDSARNQVLALNVHSFQGSGIRIAGDENVVGGCYVGTDPTGLTQLGNGGAGVLVVGADSRGNRIGRNTIWGNGRLGIDLGGDGVTRNDLLDRDQGPNGLQNYPELHRATSVGPVTIVTGWLHSAPQQSFFVELFASAAVDATRYGEGQRYLNGTVVRTDRLGNARFSITVGPTSAREWITATATSSDDNTSEFSRAIRVHPGVQSVVPPGPRDSPTGQVASTAVGRWLDESTAAWLPVAYQLPSAADQPVGDSPVSGRRTRECAVCELVEHDVSHEAWLDPLLSEVLSSR
jgi:hypothetical protein